MVERMRKFKCNYCEREIPLSLWGNPTIVCYCGAKYHKQLTLTVTEEQ